MRQSVMLLVVVGVFVLAGIANATPITVDNPSFETRGPQVGGVPWYNLPVGGGWTSTSPNVPYCINGSLGAAGGNVGVAEDGHFYYNLDASPLAQTLGYTVTLGDQIDLDFYTKASTAASVTAEVFAGSSSLGSTTFTSGTAGWTETNLVTSPATATGTLNITFSGASTFLDMVSLSATSTPEPSMIVLVATGLIALLAYAWRRRK